MLYRRPAPLWTLVAGVLGTALLVGCGAGKLDPIALPTADPIVACAAPGADPMDECVSRVLQLNHALEVTLSDMLPSTALIINNLTSVDGGFVSGPGVAFVRQQGPAGEQVYGAGVRLRDADIAGTVNVDVWTAAGPPAPAADRCAAEAASPPDREAKGIVTVECGQLPGPAGTTVFRSVTTAPYGSGEYAALLLTSVLVESYRRGGEVVRVSYEAVVEHEPSGLAASPSPRPARMLLTVGQLTALANDYTLTLVLPPKPTPTATASPTAG